MKSSSLGKIAIVLSVILFPILLFLVLSKGKYHYRHLEYFGPKEVSASGDTIYFTIPDFKFVNQNRDTITQKNFEGKIYVANFFFATCPTICPKMTDEVKR